MKKLTILGLLLVASLSQKTHALEMIIGKEYIKPGVDIIFEGAVKDHVIPLSQNLAEHKTDVHLEARINWSTNAEIPDGAPRGGFIPYLTINAEIINQENQKTSLITLTPHINLIDNFHYARNIKLPGNTDGQYTVIFHIDPPQKNALSLHHDWTHKHSNALVKEHKFVYKNLNFEAITKAVRKKTP